jgi:hypothetical protein
MEIVMTTFRLCVPVAFVLASSPVVLAQSVTLAETKLPDACFSNELTMKMTGTITGQTKVINRTLEAKHEYFERYIDAKANRVERSVRFYNKAEAKMTDGGDAAMLVLKASHQLLVAHRLREQLVVYHMQEPLTREEIDVTSHLDTLAIPGLLPGAQVKVGDTWPVPRDVVQALTSLNALEKTDLTGRLDKVDGDFAYLSFRGLADGIEDAAPVKLMVKDATAAFNLKLQRLTQLDWRVSHQQQQGPVSPSMSADFAFTLKRVPMETPVQVNNIAIVKMPAAAPPASLSNIVYRNLKKGFEFQFGRDWHMVNQSADGKLILRLVDARGEFISQCTVTPWRKTNNPLKLDEFSKMMRATEGWSQKAGAALDETDKVKSPNGYAIFRVTAEGKLGGVDALRSSYLVSAPQGEQILIDFTMLPSQAAKLDGRDATLAQSVLFVEPGRVEAVPVNNPK